MKQNRYPLCIVGGGPNALYLIERILAHKLEEPTEFEEFEIHVFDKGGHFGSGCHYSSQPKTNHLNRIAAQISFGADPTNTQDVKYLLPESLQWTLFDWCAARFEQTGEERFKIAEHSWVDRALFGEASEAVFEIYIERLRRLGIRCTLHKAEVTDIVPEEGAYTVHYSTADLFSHLTAEFLVLCTGHGSNQTAHGAVDAIRQAPRIDQIYPLEQLDGSVLPSNSTVACKGLGLAAIDLMLFLTEGRGGYFAVKLEDKRELVYHPSSFEPAAIIPFSGSGAFPMTRAKNQKLNNDDLMHKSIFLTYDAIDHMRDVAGRSATIDHVGPKRQLDFEAHILPIMIAEMALVFYGVLFGRDWRERTVQSITPIYNTYLLDCASIRDLQDGLARLHDPVQALARQTATDLQAFIQGNAPATPNFADTARAFVKFVRGAEALDELPNPADVSQFPKAVARELSKPSQWEHDPNPANHRFDWFELVDPLAAYAKQSLAKRREAATARFQWDLRQAEQGNLDNPTKSAIDGVCRDIRSVLRYAVEFGGLTAQSQNVFATNYQRLLNRLAVGTSMRL